MVNGGCFIGLLKIKVSKVYPSKLACVSVCFPSRDVCVCVCGHNFKMSLSILKAKAKEQQQKERTVGEVPPGLFC